MRKHFLLLMLMALLPLAGRAQTDITGDNVAITLNRTQLDYTGLQTGPVVQEFTIDGTSYLTDVDGTKLQVKYYDEEGNAIDATAVRNAGNYQLALVGDDSNYSGTTKKVAFTINKGSLSITLAEYTEKVYGESDPTVLEYTWDDPTQLKGSDDVNNVILTFTLSRDVNEGVGEYNYVTATVTTPNYNVTVNGTAKLKITPAELTVTYDSGSDIVKSYGAANPALDVDKISYSGFKFSDTKSVVSGTLAYTQTTEDANYNTAGDAALTGKAKYDCVFSGLTATNYTFKYPENKMIVKQVALAATPSPLPANGYFTYTKADESFTYNGADQTPTYTVKYIDAQGTEHTLDNTQVGFTYTYSSTETGTYSDASDNKTAGYYKATATAVATGNYSGSVADVAGLEYAIAKKDLWVYVKSATKVYDGSAYDLSSAEFEYNGKVDDIIPTLVTAQYVSTPADDKAVGSYNVQPVIGSGSNLNTNYNPTALTTGKYTITARPLTATAVAKTITFGEAAPSWDNTATFITLEAQNDEDKTGLISGDEATVRAALSVGLDDTYTSVGTYTDAIVITDAGTATNYTITTVPATYTISGATYTMIAQNKTITYGDNYTLNDFVCITSGADPAATVEFKLFKDGNELSELPTEVGTYDIKIVENAAYLPTNYDEPITYVPGTFTINKKNLKITPNALTLNAGATPATLNKYGTVTYTGLVEGDAIDYALAFNTTGVGCVEVDGSGNLNSTIGEYAAGVKVTAEAESDGYANKNYTINVDETGALTIIAADALMLATNDTQLKQKIADVDGDSKDVAFGSIAMAQKEWHAMVLPFATTPAELVAELGSYVVVNKLVSSTIENGVVNVKFGLEWDEIKAGEPFLIKVAGENVNWNTFAVTGKTISKDITDATSDKATFTGTYASDESLKWGYELDGTTENSNAKYQWLAQTSYKGKNKWTNPKTNAHALTPMEAYLVLASDATGANIFVEDFENGFTAIKSLSTDQVNGLKVVGEGWYTLNGVKLQGAPTQKGVYINNGKKVVIK